MSWRGRSTAWLNRGVRAEGAMVMKLGEGHDCRGGARYQWGGCVVRGRGVGVHGLSSRSV